MSPQTRAQDVAFDPTAQERYLLTLGVPPAMNAFLRRWGTPGPLVLGATVHDPAWTRIDMLLVVLREAVGSPTAGLGSPSRSAQLMTLISNLRSARAHGVQTLVFEEAQTTQPHTGALRPVTDVYVFGGSIFEAHPTAPLLASSIAHAAIIEGVWPEGTQ